MRKIALLSAATLAALSLAACSDNDADDTPDTTIIETQTSATPVPGPTVTETAVVDGNSTATTSGDSVTIDTGGVKATVGPDGANATVKPK